MQRQSFLNEVLDTISLTVAFTVVMGTMFLTLSFMNSGKQMIPSWVLYTCAAMFGIGIVLAIVVRTARGLAVGTFFLAATFFTLGLGNFMDVDSGYSEYRDIGGTFEKARFQITMFLMYAFPLIGGSVTIFIPICRKFDASRTGQHGH